VLRNHVGLGPDVQENVLMPEPNLLRNLLTIDEAAEYLRISRSSLYTLIQEGRLKPVRIIEGSPRIKVADLDKLIDASQ